MSEQTPNRGYDIPVPTNRLSEDVHRLRAAFEALDADVQQILIGLAGRALLQHAHAMGDIQGLISALAGKAAADHVHSLDDLSNVSGTAGAPTGSVLYRGAGGWQAGNPATVLGAHEHTMEQVQGLQTALSFKLDLSTLQGWTAKSSLADNDAFMILDSAPGGAGRRTLWSTVKARLLDYFNTMYSAIGHVHNGADITAGTVVDARLPSQMSGKTFTGGVSFGSTVAPAATNLSRHLALWGTTFGFSVTDDTLNHVSSLDHKWYRANGTLLATLNSAGNFEVSGQFVGNGAGLSGVLKASGLTVHNSGDAPTIAAITGQRAVLNILNAGNQAASAIIQFHRSGSYAANFGLDTDNQWKVGGWSMGQVAYRIWHEGNLSALAAALTWQGGAGGDTVFPIGHTVAVVNADQDGGTANRNDAKTIRLHESNAYQYRVGNAGAVLSGIWRSRGYLTSSTGIFQRVA
jgi:hypothetical protein